MDINSKESIGVNTRTITSEQEGYVHFADPQSMDYHDGLPKWTAKWTTHMHYQNGLP